MDCETVFRPAAGSPTAMITWSETETGRGAVTVTAPDRAALLSDLAARFEAREGFTVATINLDHVIKLAHDRAFREAYAVQTHVTADGNPIVWLSRLAGQSEVTLVPGADLIEPVAALATVRGVPVGLFG